MRDGAACVGLPWGTQAGKGDPASLVASGDTIGRAPHYGGWGRSERERRPRPRRGDLLLQRGLAPLPHR